MSNKKMLHKIRDIKAWYWKHEKNLDIKNKIDPSILLELNKLDNSLRTSQNKDTVPIWGPSQSGKSVFVSKVIDYYNYKEKLYDSAISWDANDKIIFSNNPIYFNVGDKLPKIFNNYNNGGDSTITATRFYLPTDPNGVNKEYPATVLIGSIENILHTITEGYLYSIGKMHDNIEIDKNYLENLLNNEYDDTNSDDTVDQEGFSLVSDLISVIDNLIFSNRRRFIKLKINNSWNYLRERILTNKKLNSDSDIALDFIKKILWDNRKDVNEVFDSILITYNTINEQLVDKKLVCKVDTASSLSSLQALNDNGSNGKYFELTENGNNLIITLTSKNRGNNFRLNNLQAIILEVQIPLREEILRKINEKSIKFFKKCDFLDLPGTTLIVQQIRETPTITQTDIIKRGKISSTIFNYAETLQFSSFLLNIRTAGTYDLEEITQGIELIYSKIDSDYYENIKKLKRDKNKLTTTPIPLQIIFSFFNTAFDNFLSNYKVNKGENSLDNYETFLSGKVDFLSPSNAYSLATNYYWFKDGTSPLVETNYNTLENDFKNVKWFKQRFVHEGEKESVDELINNQKNGDGGVSYVLNATLDILNEQPNKVDRNKIYSDKLNNIIAQITPTDRSSGNTANIQQTYKKFTTMLDEKFKTYSNSENIEDYIDDIIMFSKNLRDLRSFDSSDIEFIPSIDISSKNFYKTIISKWIGKRISIIRKLGFNGKEAKIIAEVLAEKIISNIDKIQKDIEDIFLNAKSGDEILRSVITKYIANMLRGVNNKESTSLEDIRKRCEDIFNHDNYIGSNKRVVIARMHLNNIVNKHIEELKLINAKLSQDTGNLQAVKELKEIINPAPKGVENV